MVTALIVIGAGAVVVILEMKGYGPVRRRDLTRRRRHDA
jgi:hypothetical protein